MNTLLLTSAPGFELQTVIALAYLQTNTGQTITDQNGSPIQVGQPVSEYLPIPNGPFWDLCLDASGNIAMAAAPYALAQDAASAVRTFLGECWYDTALGLPYFTQILGQSPVPYGFIKAQCVAAALTVPGVVSAKMFITSIAERQLIGQLQITDSAGNIQAVNI